MRAAVCRGVDHITLEDLDDPVPGPGEVKIRVVATGVCHTDLSVLRGNLPAPMPIVLGHEGAGVVVELGPGVDTLEVGDHVICSILLGCGHCFQCLRGDRALCEKVVFYTGRMPDGTIRLHRGDEEIHSLAFQASFAEYAVVPAGLAVPVRRDAPLDKVAGLACGLSTGLGAAIVRAEVEPGSSVVVMGAGGVGLAAMMGATFRGATTVVAVDLVPAKARRAVEIGVATHAVDPSDSDVVETVRSLTGGRGADYGFDAVGARGTAETVVTATRKGGTSVIIGRMGADVSVTLDTVLLLQQRIVTGTVGGSITPHRHIPEFVDLYLQGRLDFDAIMDARYDLDGVPAALDDLDAHRVTRGVVVL